MTFDVHTVDDLIDVVWFLLDMRETTPDEIKTIVTTAIDTWEPLPNDT